jgi:GDPmannose 4,6-dehydratase
MTPEPTLHRARRRVLLTGAAGQDGQYLAEQLLAEGAHVFGLEMAGRACAAEGVTMLEADMRDASSLRRAIDAAEPDEVYNLAAVTIVPGSWEDPGSVIDINALGVQRLATALRESGAAVRLCHASSAEIFGATAGHPLGEDDDLAPTTPYGVSKAQAHRFVARLREEEGFFACSAILFNHESPRRPPSFVTRKITMAAARIARGLEQTLVLGNLDAARDWGYAPEYTTAMRLMVRSATPRDYVVATGRSATVGEFARLAFARVGLDWRRHVTSDPALLRAGDGAARIGDPSRIARELGWKATTSLEELVAIMVDADLALPVG